MEFMDEAAIANGRLPEDVLTNEEILARLPVLFRRLRVQSIEAQEQLDLLEPS